MKGAIKYINRDFFTVSKNINIAKDIYEQSGGRNMADKPHLNLATIGHVDHGKSTLVGRLLLDTGQFPEHIVKKYKEEAKEERQ